MMIGVLGSLAEYERELMKERTPSKRAASRANGARFGSPGRSTDAEHIATAKRMKADGHTGKDIAKYFGVSRATLYRCLEKAARHQASPPTAAGTAEIIEGDEDL